MRVNTFLATRLKLIKSHDETTHFFFGHLSKIQFFVSNERFSLPIPPRCKTTGSPPFHKKTRAVLSPFAIEIPCQSTRSFSTRDLIDEDYEVAGVKSRHDTISNLRYNSMRTAMIAARSPINYKLMQLDRPSAIRDNRGQDRCCDRSIRN